jgi:hypothetical protein
MATAISQSSRPMLWILLGTTRMKEPLQSFSSHARAAQTQAFRGNGRR